MTDEENNSLNQYKNSDWDGREKVKELFIDHPCITVEYSFLEAIKLIGSGEMEAYDLFIFDRNIIFFRSECQ